MVRPRMSAPSGQRRRQGDRPARLRHQFQMQEGGAHRRRRFPVRDRQRAGQQAAVDGEGQIPRARRQQRIAKGPRAGVFRTIPPDARDCRVSSNPSGSTA